MSNIQANVLKVAELTDKDKKYLVPAYQRPYRWDVEDAEKLLLDVYDSFETGKSEYFIGGMICVSKDADDCCREVYEIVDGQQRLITLTLIIKGLSAFLQDAEKEKSDLADRVLRPLLYKGESGIFYPLVVVRKSEQQCYIDILKGIDVPVGKMTSVQKVFFQNSTKIHELLKKIGNEIDAKKMLGLADYLLYQVFVVFVKADDFGSSYRLFNVLNTRGVPLNDADLIKNALFEKASNNSSLSTHVEDQWSQVESLVGEENLFDFLRFHLISEKEKRDRALKVGKKALRVYEYYEHLLKNRFSGNPSAMLDVILQSAHNYAYTLYENASGDKESAHARTIALLTKFKHIEWLPALMSFLNKGHPKDKFPAFAKLIEKVYIQSVLIGNARDDGCYHAVEAINQGKSVGEIMRYVRARADNAKFEKVLDSEEFYNPSRRLIINFIRAILIRVDETYYEHLGPKEYTKRISVEHILPQSRTNKYWKKRFNEEQHQEWLHKLGNLTLLSSGMNAAAKNYGFDRKKEVYETKNKKCPFGMTRELCELPEFNLAALKDRHEKLKGEILDMWKV